MENKENAMIEVYGNRCWIDENWTPGIERLSMHQIYTPEYGGVEQWENTALLSDEGYNYLLKLKSEFPKTYKMVLGLLYELNVSYKEIEPEYYCELNNIITAGCFKSDLNKGSVKNLRNAMIQIYGDHCWMDPNWPNTCKNNRDKKLSLHHILEARNGGQILWENIALLSRSEHDYLNYLDKQYHKIYEELNGLFTELNRTYSPPTDAYYDEVEHVLAKVK